jgi:hypothetical protein
VAAGREALGRADKPDRGLVHCLARLIPGPPRCGHPTAVRRVTEQFLTPQVLHHERDDPPVWYGFGLEFVTDHNGRRIRNYYKAGANPGVTESCGNPPTNST